jgi:hypothetical protein
VADLDDFTIMPDSLNRTEIKTAAGKAANSANQPALIIECRPNPYTKPPAATLRPLARAVSDPISEEKVLTIYIKNGPA